VGLGQKCYAEGPVATQAQTLAPAGLITRASEWFRRRSVKRGAADQEGGSRTEIRTS